MSNVKQQRKISGDFSLFSWELFCRQKHWLRLRQLTVRLLSTALYLVEGSMNDSTHLPDLMTRLLGEFTDLLSNHWRQFSPIQVRLHKTNCVLKEIVMLYRGKR